jgi:hypothetical protein
VFQQSIRFSVFLTFEGGMSGVCDEFGGVIWATHWVLSSSSISELSGFMPSL